MYKKMLYATLSCLFSVGILGACNGGTGENDTQDGTDGDDMETEIEEDPTDVGIEEDHSEDELSDQDNTREP